MHRKNKPVVKSNKATSKRHKSHKILRYTGKHIERLRASLVIDSRTRVID